MNNFYAVDRPYHLAITRAITGKTIKDEEATTLYSLLYFRDATTGRCNPSNKKIAEVNARSESTVKRHIKILKKAGLIKYIKGGIINKKHQTNQYIFTVKINDHELVDVFTGEVHEYEATAEIENEPQIETAAAEAPVAEPEVDIIDKAVKLFKGGNYIGALVTIRDKRDVENKREEIEADFDRFTTALHRVYNDGEHTQTYINDKLDRCHLERYKYKFEDYPTQVGFN